MLPEVFEEMLRRLLIAYGVALLVGPFALAWLMSQLEGGCMATGELCPNVFRPFAIIVDLTIGAVMLVHFCIAAVRRLVDRRTICLPLAATAIALGLVPAGQTVCESGGVCMRSNDTRLPVLAPAQAEAPKVR